MEIADNYDANIFDRAKIYNHLLKLFKIVTRNVLPDLVNEQFSNISNNFFT